MKNNFTQSRVYVLDPGEAFNDCHIVVSPIIFSDFNKSLLRILFLF